MPATAAPTREVFVIDDDPVMRDLLLLVLGMEGDSVRAAESGEDALHQLSSSTLYDCPLVLLVDLQLPGVSGNRLATRLRQVCPKALLVAMSASRPLSRKLKGFDAFLQKPFTAADFAAAVAQPALQNPKPAKAAIPPQQPPTEPLAAEQTSLDETVYTKLTTTMPPAQLKQLYAMCLDDAATRLARMKLSAGAGDGPAFSSEAHAIKGGCGMLGARELYDLASRMEKGALLCTSLLNDFPHAAQRLRRILDART